MHAKFHTFKFRTIVVVRKNFDYGIYSPVYRDLSVSATMPKCGQGNLHTAQHTHFNDQLEC